MAMRKEQVLALVVLALAAWIGSGLFAGDGAMRKPSSKMLDYTAASVREAALVTGAIGSVARAEMFTEPRETRALPPRELDFPQHAPLSLAALPLEPGPDYGHALLLRDSGATVDGVALQSGTETPAAAPESAAPTEAQGNPNDRKAILAQTYDQLFLVGLNAPYWGFIEVEGVDPFDAEKLTAFDDKIVRFRQYSEKQQKLQPLTVYDKDNPNKVRLVHLADNLRNEVTRKIRAVPNDGGHQEQRAELITWLLGKAREAAWVYDEAMAQAKAYAQYGGEDIEGLRWQLRVLQARGDLAGEFALLDGISGLHRESAFRYEGLGLVKKKLCLHADAEVDLRRACELGRTDARPHASLAEFLRERGRSREAVAVVQRAEQTLSGLVDPSDRVRVVAAIVSCHLAVGQLDAARAAMAQLPADRPLPYLAGCVAYAAGDLPAALGAFRQASAGAEGSAALLGQGAVLLRQQQWQEAHDIFVAVADQAPLLRHRAWSGLALLYQRIGQLDQSLAWADRAIEANPQDAYTLYLRGRTLRLQKQLAAAQETLLATLRLQDDFVHAIAEMAALQQARADEARGEEQATATLSARSYGNRAVALAHVPTVELFEWQAMYRFAAGDAIQAGAAFAQARDTATADADRLFAKGAIAVVDYSRGQVDDAVAALQRFSELPKEDPMRKWAETTLQDIDDHAQKEMLEDHFERIDLGGIWPDERDVNLRAEIKDNRLAFRGTLSRPGQSEVWVERAGAVQRAKNFLAVGCTLQLGREHGRGEGFAGLRIETQKGSTGIADCQIQVGIREGKPHLRLVDNREEAKLFDLKVVGFDPTAVQELELRVVPRGDQKAASFGLQVRWNGYVVHEQELKSLGGSTGSELRTVLFVNGTKGSKIDVSFDDYRLERRKER